MKTREDVISGAISIIHELSLILNSKALLESREERDKLGLKVFTKQCPFAWTNGIFVKTKTFPWKEKKFQKRHIMLRFIFWNKFAEQAHKTEGKDLTDLIHKSIIKADEEAIKTTQLEYSNV